LLSHLLQQPCCMHVPGILSPNIHTCHVQWVLSVGCFWLL